MYFSHNVVLRARLEFWRQKLDVHVSYASDEWRVATAETSKDESTLIGAGFDYVRYCEKDKVAIYRKRK